MPQPHHEKLQTISDIVREQLSSHDQEGGNHTDDVAHSIAVHAIRTFMPELGSLQKSQLVVDASRAIVLGDDLAESYEGVHVQATLTRISLQELVSTVPKTEPPLTYTSFDLCAVFEPRYIDPDPQELVFGQEVFIPFRDVTRFDIAS